MDLFINQTGVVRRTARCPETVARAIATGKIKADALLLNGDKHSLLFRADRLPELRRALGPETEAR
jgi:hypothetical protein